VERGSQVWCGRLWGVGCRLVIVIERVEEMVEETF
jgi:hypothetical protein